jgi:FkbM family methyltransferase
MTTEEILARRRAANERSGNDFLHDADAQRDLHFSWTGSTVSDSCPQIDLEYIYPSAVGSNLFLHGSFEAGELAITSAIIGQTESPIILDIGANIGLHSVRWSQASPKARIYACEPVPTNALLLERNLARNCVAERVEAVPVAFGRAGGVLTLFESADGAYSSAIEEHARPVVAKHEVDAITVDAFAAQRHLARIDFIKIDVEGYEGDVIEGALETLRRDAPSLFVEISPMTEGRAPEELIELLVSLGYHAYAINSGIVTAHERYDHRAYNYLFIHPRRELIAPTTCAQTAREELFFISYLHDRAEELLRPMSHAADERLALIMQTAARESDAHHRRIEPGEALELLSSLREQVRALCESSSGANGTAARATSGDALAGALAERDRLRASIQHEADARLVLLNEATLAAQERLQALEAASAEIETLQRSLVSIAAVAEERLRVLEANDREAASLRAALEALQTSGRGRAARQYPWQR